AKQEKNDGYESKAYFYLANLCGTISQKDSAFYYYDKAIQKANQINDDKTVLYYKVNKSNYLFSEFDFDGALSLYNECLDLAKKTNDTYTYDYIIIKKGNITYEIGKYKESLEIFKKGIQRKDFKKETILGIQLSISKAYLKLNEPDSAFIYTKKGIVESQKSKLDEFEMHFLNQQGLILIYKNNYPKAKEVFDKALQLSEKSNILEMTRLILINMSKLYTLQNENSKAIEILEQILENKNKIALSSERLAEIHYLLAENYKVTNNLSVSNIHLQKFIEEEKKLGQKKIETIDYLHKIDVSEINNQKTAQITQKKILIIILIIFIIVIVSIFYRKKKNDNENQVRFDNLLQKINDFENELSKRELIDTNVSQNLKETIVSETQMDFQEHILDDNNLLIDFADNHIEAEDIDEDLKIEGEMLSNSFVIKDKTITEILEKLIKLEEKKYFLNQECTLHNVAKKVKTNTAYLSKIVNNELGKTFSTYINELRINYIIIELKNNSKLRSYSINAIAEEIGYKSSDSFTKYFNATTGISPTIYIKKINKLLEK
uniref:helix-turn-helix domain-containing protein n=1 Tax=Flavobacterium sp. TaxID=239 RepID=UPI00286DCF89